MATQLKPWDVVVVPFPYTDRNSKKRRPALIVSSNALHETHGLYWLVMITSAKNKAWKHDVVVRNLAKTGLTANSVVRVAKITTVDEQAILRRIGSLSVAERKDVSKKIALYLG